MESYITVSGEVTAEISEKRSRFIAVVSYTPTEQAANEFIAKIKAKHRDARHNCFAYSVSGGEIERYSDDGEPHGTAGKPMLDIIKGAGITDVTVVVTRYFGGVLLGTGGLVRAYSDATKNAVVLVKRVKIEPCVVFKTVCDYADHERVLRLIKDSGGEVENTEFAENIELTAFFSIEEGEQFPQRLKEAFSARLETEEIKREYRPKENF